MLQMVLRYVNRELARCVDELDRHALRLLFAPPLQEREHDVFAAHPRLQLALEHDPARLSEGEIDITRRPAEAERRRANADTDGAVRAVRAAVRVSAGHELSGHDEALLGKVEVEDAVARRRVVGLFHALLSRELAADGRLLGRRRRCR